MFRLKLSKLLAAISVLAIISVFVPTPLPVFAVDTGYKSPIAQAAGPGGDANGFESNPLNASADDSVFAVDTLSGTSSSGSCTSTARDKQDYFNYGFALPGGSTINGVEVRLDAKVDSVGNETPALCVQLSTDGGATWTTTKQTPTLTTAEATYVLGGTADLWGRTWTTTDFADANFRVRLITIAFSNQRTFSLDWAAVKVYYTSSGPTATNTTTGPTNTPLPPTNTPTQTNTSLPTNTPTVGPSPTPTRTNTPVSSTNTPTRTNTPGPTNTPGGSGNPISVYGVWHCSSDACIWGTIRDMTNFDQMNHWVIDRGDGSGKPSVNMVVLAFVEPLKLLNQTTDATTLNGVPRGFTPEIVNYFESRGVRVMASIGGITYVTPWNTALSTNGYQLGLNAAAMATNLGIGVEIDWEENAPSAAEMAGLQSFVDAYRSVHPYDATGNDHAARLTIDLAAGDRWLIDITTKATTDWLLPSNVGTPVLDHANAMVSRGDGTPTTWQEHIDGKSNYSPPIPPLAAAKFTGSLWLHGNNAACNNFASSPQKADATYVQTVQTKIGTTNGMLGFMFWAAECEGTKTVCTTPPNTCEGGMGVAASTFNIPIPMPALRQQ